MFGSRRWAVSGAVVLALLLVGGLLPLRGRAADEMTEKQRQELATKKQELALVMMRALYPKAKYPQGHPHLATSLNSLGALLRDQGEHARAEPFLREALAMRRALYPKEKYPQGHPDLANSLNNRGYLLSAQGEYGKAEPFYRQALAMRRALYPKAKYPQGHPELAGSLTNLGFLLQDQGEYAKAWRCTAANSSAWPRSAPRRWRSTSPPPSPRPRMVTSRSPAACPRPRGTMKRCGSARPCSAASWSDVTLTCSPARIPTRTNSPAS
jgi:tetratricopeptide (TPR) repeat protein